MKVIKVILWGIVFFIFFAACKEDDHYVYPPVITEILSAGTGEDGVIFVLHTDKGKTFRVVNKNTTGNYTPDSLYRGICIYEVADSMQKESEVRIYGFRQIVSPDPIPATQITGGIKTDSVTVQSIWKSGDYINLALLVEAQNGIHLFHFIEDKLILAEKEHALYLTLYHDQSRDIPTYNQKVYLSVPLSKYKGILFPGNPIYFTINTYKKGPVTYRLTY